MKAGSWRRSVTLLGPSLLVTASILAALANFVPWWSAAVVGLLAGIGGLAGDRLLQRRAIEQKWMVAWCAATTPGPSSDEKSNWDSLLGSLNPDSPNAVRFNLIRERDVERLLVWCNDHNHSERVWLVTGVPGTGKTRLLMEVASRLGNVGWVCGWVKRGYETPALETATRGRESTLLIVDDAETRTSMVDMLAAASCALDPRIRIVVAARRLGEWWTQARATLEPDVARTLPTAANIRLIPFATTVHDQQQLFDLAVRHFAGRKGINPPAVTLAAPRSPVPILLLHAAALTAIHENLAGAVDIDTTVRTLFEAEEEWWQATADQVELDTVRQDTLNTIGTATLRRAVLAAVLIGADSLDDAVRTLRHLPGMARSRSDTLKALANWLRELYPQRAGQWLNPHLPARLVEHYMIEQLANDSQLLVAIAAAVRPDPDIMADNILVERAIRVFKTLATAATYNPAAVQTITNLICYDPRGLIPVAVKAAQDGHAIIDQAIAGAVIETACALTAADLADITGQMTASGSRLAHTAAAVAHAHLAHLDTVSRTSPVRAEHLANLGRHRLNLGQHQEALTSITEAVGIYRQLMTISPAEHESALATALTNRGTCLWYLGQRTEALRTTTEATDILRRLSAANPAAHAQALADGLITLGQILADAGRHEQALSASADAVDIYRRLATADPTTNDPGLARQLHALSLRLADLGQRKEALAVSAEAAKILRRLAMIDPDAYEPILAAALSSLGARLSDMGQPDSAHIATGESMGIYRRLAAANPAVHQRALAVVLRAHGNHVADVGQLEEALAHVAEAVDIFRHLAAANPAKDEPGLAHSLGTLGIQLAGTGRCKEAVAAATEAADILRRLAATDPDAHEPGLGAALNSLGLRLSELGKHNEAIPRATEAVHILRRLAAENPGKHEPDLGNALNNLAKAMSEAQQWNYTVNTLEEALRLYRRLHARLPEVFGPTVTALENNLRIARKHAEPE